MGVSEGGPLSMLFAAAHPERTRALILCGAEVKEETTGDWPWGEATRAEFEQAMDLERVIERWGKGLSTDYLFPRRQGDEAFRNWFGRLQMQSATPNDAVAFMRMAFEIDVRHVAPSVKVPTLILHRTEDPVCHVENARWLARSIEGSRYLELPGNDHVPWADQDEILAETQEFLTGVREPAEPDRVLATVLFTDIVGSTEPRKRSATAAGVTCSSDITRIIRNELTRFRGREIDTAGDGFFAAFDGPARAIRCALAIRGAASELGLELRAGLHTGECELLGDKIAGIAVHTGARVAAQAGPNEVLVSGTVRDLVSGSGIAFEDRGEHELKGIGPRQVFAVL